MSAGKHCKSSPRHSCGRLHHRLPTAATYVRSVVHEHCLPVTSAQLELLKPHNKYLTINSERYKQSPAMLLRFLFLEWVSVLGADFLCSPTKMTPLLFIILAKAWPLDSAYSNLPFDEIFLAVISLARRIPAHMPRSRV